MSKLKLELETEPVLLKGRISQAKQKNPSTDQVGKTIWRRVSFLSMANECTHTNEIHEVTPSAEGCEDCLKIGDTWMHLRLCMTCGHVGCCDSSKNKHATKHFHATNHPIIKSFQPGEDWGWCYVDEVMFDEL